MTSTDTKHKSILYLLIVGMAVFIWLRSCQPEPATVTITVPEVKGSFAPVKPDHTPVPIQDPEVVEKWNTKYKENPINQQMVDENRQLQAAYDKADSTAKANMYSNAIQLNAFNHGFDDEFTTAQVSGFVQGEIKSMQLSYTLKQREIDVALPAKNHVLISAEIGNTTALDKFGAKAGLMLQNKSGNILQASYGIDKTIWIGYAHRLW